MGQNDVAVSQHKRSNTALFASQSWAPSGQFCTTELCRAFGNMWYAATGKDKEVVRKDIGRNRYFTPQQAIEYGVIDRIVQPSDAVAIEGKNYEAQLQASQAQQRGQRVPAGAGASAEGGY